MDKELFFGLTIGLLGGMLICATFPKVKAAVQNGKEEVAKATKKLAKKAKKAVKSLKSEEADGEEESIAE